MKVTIMSNLSPFGGAATVRKAQISGVHIRNAEGDVLWSPTTTAEADCGISVANESDPAAILSAII